jgi:hypothetical protein
VTAGVTEPRHTDSLSDGELFDAFTDFEDRADDLMAEHEREFRAPELAVAHVEVGSADPATKHAHQDFVRPRLGIRKLRRTERRMSVVEQHRAHTRPRGRSV